MLGPYEVFSQPRSRSSPSPALYPALAVAYCPVSVLWASGSLRCWEGGVHPGPSLGAGGALTTLRTLGETQQAKGGGLVGVRGEKLTQMGRVEVWG